MAVRRPRKYQRQHWERAQQLRLLRENEHAFRRIARRQVEARALRKLAALRDADSGTDEPCTFDECYHRGVRALAMTPELCGLFGKVNRTRKSLRLDEYTQGYELLIR